MVAAPLAAVDWPDSRRIVSTIYPPIHLFEDAAEPADWELLASLEAKTNPRVLEVVGNLGMVPVERRFAGAGAGYAMAPFVHASPSRPSRFSDGSYGAWYGGVVFEVALMETAHHFARFMQKTAEPAGERDYRELVASVRGDLHDLTTGFDRCFAPASWTESQEVAHELRADNSNGVVYRSVRCPTNLACALFYPDLLAPPVIQGRHLRYKWDGKEMTGYFVYGGESWHPLPQG